MAPSLKRFKNRLNNVWKNHPSKFSVQCYTKNVYDDNVKSFDLSALSIS